MCGIVGIVSDKNCCDYIFDGLRLVQYRGYDSVGICQKDGMQLKIDKAKGTIEKLVQKVEPLQDTKVAIGHTRWATHGSVCERNAHPIEGKNREWVVVHNGIIENYQTLMCEMQKEGEVFKTQTDTEVIANLLSFNNYQNPIENLIWAVRKLQGSYAICAVKKEQENCIYAAKYKSPLYAFCNQDIAMLASDPICFPEGDYYKLEDGELCEAKKGEIKFFNMHGEQIQKQQLKYQKIRVMADKGSYQHYMLKEIYETPEALERLIKNFVNFDFKKIARYKFKKVKLIGCGTAYHSCLMGARYFIKHLHVDAEAIFASEFRYDDYVINPQTLCIFVSQSGETADTIAALEKAKRKRAKIISMTNVPYSTIASLSDVVLPISAGVEVAVASTKAYSCQVAGLYLLVMALKGEKHFNRAIKQVQEVILASKNFFVNMSAFAEDISQKEKVLFIGKGCDYITALEAALKLKETTYINCSALPSGELKHGTLSLIENKTPLIVISTNKKVHDKVMNSALEAKSRGAKLYLISFKPPKICELENFDFCLSLPKVCQPLLCILAIIPLQLLSYNVALLRGLDPDKPRNLAKSVTVE